MSLLRHRVGDHKWVDLSKKSVELLGHVAVFWINAFIFGVPNVIYSCRSMTFLSKLSQRFRTRTKEYHTEQATTRSTTVDRSILLHQAHPAIEVVESHKITINGQPSNDQTNHEKDTEKPLFAGYRYEVNGTDQSCPSETAVQRTAHTRSLRTSFARLRNADGSRSVIYKPIRQNTAAHTAQSCTSGDKPTLKVKQTHHVNSLSTVLQSRSSNRMERGVQTETYSTSVDCSQQMSPRSIVSSAYGSAGDSVHSSSSDRAEMVLENPDPQTPIRGYVVDSRSDVTESGQSERTADFKVPPPPPPPPLPTPVTIPPLPPNRAGGLMSIPGTCI
ncbi:hypothetical protein EG68_06884 [Paragonimus skrjabini miyazakii]|uniref:Uncharacterized protein n=1 Tax=Paragonimus skrjabini miyazakii TaxID=59628 RepID=A0A8S9YN21_9TREM|nr:hypothetical protein EG68_06884 [Paragonimus skrjabini miyazakii]